MEKTLASSEYAQFKEEFKKEVVKKCVIKRFIEVLYFLWARIVIILV